LYGKNPLLKAFTAGTYASEKSCQCSAFGTEKLVEVLMLARKTSSLTRRAKPASAIRVFTTFNISREGALFLLSVSAISE